MKIGDLKFGPMFAVAALSAALAAPMAASAEGWGFVGLLPANATVLLTPAQIIQSKAAALGFQVTGYAISDLEAVPNGHRIRYQNCDIYYSPAAGCHEIRGDIRARYDSMGGPFGHMGLPKSDELVTSDGIGRYSEVSFPGKAIYASPDTGAFPLEGDMRRVWVALGAEKSPLGYPTAGAAYQSGKLWGEFQNDVMCFEGATLRTPATAGLTRDQVGKVLRKMIRDRLFTEVTLERFSITNVSPTGYDLAQSRNRLITVRIEGRRIIYGDRDPTYVMDLQFLLFAQKEADGSKSLRVKLMHYEWTTRSPGQLYSGIEKELAADLQRAVNRWAPSVLLIDVPIPASLPFSSFKVLPDGAIKLFLPADGGGDLVGLAAQFAFDRLAK